MNFLLAILVTILQGYIAITNQWAEGILALSQPAPTVANSPAEQPHLTRLVSEYGVSSSFSNILLRNREYQQAAVFDSTGQVLETTTNNPIQALVNIYCTLRTTDSIRTTTGTGVFVHASGVILTNAHVAQFLLLQNTTHFEDASCVIRTGNPATAQYTAELLYIPPSWIQKHAALIRDVAPSGTGERDYALLYITESLTEEPLPEIFPALSSNSGPLPTITNRSQVTVMGYPAADLLAAGSHVDIFPRSATTTISELYTFGANNPDVIGVRSTIVGVQGSSGGPVITEDGRIIGLITTRGDITRDGPGSLRAITLSHIDRTIRQETGFSFIQNLQGDLSYRAAIFHATLAPFLTRTLEQQLQQ